MFILQPSQDMISHVLASPSLTGTGTLTKENFCNEKGYMQTQKIHQYYCKVPFKSLSSPFLNSLYAFHTNFHNLHYYNSHSACLFRHSTVKFVEIRLYLLILASQEPRRGVGIEEAFSACLLNDCSDLTKMAVNQW